MLQDLLTVSLKQQGGHTQAIGVKAFELVIEAVDLCLMKITLTGFDVSFNIFDLPWWYKTSSNHPRKMWKWKTLEASEHDLWHETRAREEPEKEVFLNTFVTTSFSALQRGKELYLFGDFRQKEEI